QIWLARMLGEESPRYAHVPLVVASDGSARLEKRTRGAMVRELREAGVSPERVVGALAHGLGLVEDAAPRTARDVARWVGDGVGGRRGREVEGIGWRRQPWPIPAAW